MAERSTFRKKIVNTKQLSGDQPKFFVKHFPASDKFNYNDIKLHYYYIEEHKNPSAVLFFFHGMYFHGDGSGYFADVLSKNTSVNIYSLDFKNAGKSEGECPGYYESI